MLRLLFALMIFALLAGTAEADPKDRLRLPSTASDLQTPKPLRGPANPCAAYGAGFTRVAGSDTCVRVGGSTSVGVGVGNSGVTIPR